MHISFADEGDDEGYGSHEENLATENARLRHELERFQRLRRYRSSSVGRRTNENLASAARASTNVGLQGRALEQLREVSEENDALVEKLRAQEAELEDLRADCGKLQKRLDEEHRQRFQESAEVKESPNRIWKKHTQDIMKQMQAEKDRELAKADQSRKLLKLQYDDSQARCSKSRGEIVRLESELAHAEANALRQQAKLEDLERHCEELRSMLQHEKGSAELLRATVHRLEDELEGERLRHPQQGGGMGETLDMLDRYTNQRRLSGSSCPEELCQLAPPTPPEISGRLEEELAELQRECEQLRSQLAVAKRAQAQQHELASGAGEECEQLRAQLALAKRAHAEQEGAGGTSEELRGECEDLRRRLGTAEMRLEESSREGAALKSQLAAAAEESATPSHLRGAALLDRDELPRECERLRAQLSLAEEELARTWGGNAPGAAANAGAPEAAASPDAGSPPGAHGQRGVGEDAAGQEPRQWALRVAASAVRREYERLSREPGALGGAAAAASSQGPAGGVAGEGAVGARGGACSNCAAAQEQLKAAEDVIGKLRREKEQTRRELADSQALEKEHRGAADQLRRQMDAMGRTPATPPREVRRVPSTGSSGSQSGPPPKAGQPPLLQLAGALSSTPQSGGQPATPAAAASPAAAPRGGPHGGPQLLDEERAEYERRQQELVEACAALERRLELVLDGGDDKLKELGQELIALGRQCAGLQERLHEAKMAELEAWRRADEIPGLLARIRALEKQLADADKEIAQWKDVANSSTWSGFFGGLTCASPCGR